MSNSPQRSIPEDGLDLTRIVIDVFRATGEPISEPALRDLVVDTAGVLTTNGFAGALAWAMAETTDYGQPLLTRSAEAALHPHPEMVAARADCGIHPAVIILLVRQTREALEVGSESVLEAAISRLRRAAETHPSGAAAAASIGFQIMDQGEPAGRLFVLIVMEHGWPEIAAAAAGRLASSYQATRDHETAELFWRYAVDRGLTEHLPEAEVELAYCTYRQGREEEATELLRAAEPQTAYRYARALDERGESEAAFWAYDAVIVGGDPTAAPMAAYVAGLQSEIAERFDVACRYYETAVGFPSFEFRTQSAVNLARLAQVLLTHDRAPSAIRALAWAADAGSPEDPDSIFNPAVTQLTLLLIRHPAEYPVVLQQAPQQVAACVSAVYPTALENVGRIPDAIRACEIAIASGRPQPAWEAGRNLGRLLRIHEDIPNSSAALAMVADPPAPGRGRAV